MSPAGAVIFSVLIMSGIMTSGGVHAKYGIPLWLWAGANGALFVLFCAVEVRAFLRRRKNKDPEQNPEA